MEKTRQPRTFDSAVMQEIVVNLHMHTRYSDGGGSHREIVDSAMKARLDVVIVTDHNVLVGGIEGYREADGRKLLVLVGEEVHDRLRSPQKDHLLVLGASRELTPLADDTAALVSAVEEAGGLSFLAHPDDPSAPAFSEPDISWENWGLTHFTGIELWNGFSELKTLIPTKLHGILYAFFPALVAHWPLSRTLRRWDELLSRRQIVAIGGSDAHASRMRLGPLRRTVFPYEYHFGAVNTHVLLAGPLSGNTTEDAREIYAALAAGHCFIANDLPHAARGFRFTARGSTSDASMGDAIAAQGGTTLHAQLPAPAEIRLLKDGQVILTCKDARALTVRADRPGVYRVEAYRRHMGQRRGWIFSNPIYVQ